MIEDALTRWRRPGVSRHITCHEILEAQSARVRPFPDWVDDRLIRALSQRGIDQLYEHQWQAAEATRRGEDVVIATPTASGKTLCYNLPVFSRSAGRSRRPGAVPLSHQGPGPGSG